MLTTTGKYFWIPTERVEHVAFHKPQRPRDLYWRRVSMSVRDGPDGEVFLPVLYDSDEAEPRYRLGRATDWRQEEGGPVRGVGQRAFLVGEELRPILELGELSFDGSAG